MIKRRYLLLYGSLLVIFALVFLLSNQVLNRYGTAIFGVNDLTGIEAQVRSGSAAAGPMITLSDTITVIAPRSIRTSETKPVVVRVELDIVGHSDEIFQESPPTNGIFSTDPPRPPEIISAYNEYYEVRISADGLNALPEEYQARKSFGSISQSDVFARIHDLEWQWTLSAAEPGDRLVLISGLTQYPLYEVPRPWTIPDGAAFLTRDTLTIPIKVLTPSGLTAQQADLLSLASAVIGLVAAVLGLSIWKGLSLLRTKRTAGPEKTDAKRLILPGDPRYKDD